MKLFERGAPLIRLIDNIGKLTVLNLLFVLCSIPVVTLPASLTALYGCAIRLLRGGDADSGEFFRIFKRDFKKATLVGLILAVVGALLYADYWMIEREVLPLPAAFTYVLYALIFLLAATATYVFPMIAQFENTCARYLKNSLLFALRSLPSTLIMMVLNLMPVMILLLNVDVFLRVIVIWVVLGWGLTAFINARLFLRVFRPYFTEIPEMSEEEESD